MALLSQANLTPAQQAANNLRQIVVQLFGYLGQGGLAGYNLIWNNRNATPQQVIAALGTDAAAVFQFAELNVNTVGSAATIGGVTPPTLPPIPAGWTLAPNEDGSMTVTPPPATVPAGVTLTNKTLSWTAVVGATVYTVQKSIDNGTTWKTLTGVVPPAVSFTDNSAASGNQYKVAVTTPGGTSAFSAAVTVPTPAPATPPASS